MFMSRSCGGTERQGFLAFLQRRLDGAWGDSDKAVKGFPRATHVRRRAGIRPKGEEDGRRRCQRWPGFPSREMTGSIGFLQWLGFTRAKWSVRCTLFESRCHNRLRQLGNMNLLEEATSDHSWDFRSLFHSILIPRTFLLHMPSISDTFIPSHPCFFKHSHRLAQSLWEITARRKLLIPLGMMAVGPISRPRSA